MEWESAGIVLAVAPYGEGDALATVFTEAYGTFRGLARGGGSRSKSPIWQVGNLIEARWVARLADQLGSFAGDLVHPAAALAMADPIALGVLSAACAVAEGGLAERQAQAAVFRGLLHLIVHPGEGPACAAGLAGWEVGVLSELGYGLDFSRCAISGATAGLAFVSPKTGRAVGAEAAGAWRERLLPLPAFLLGAVRPHWADVAAGLRLTGHFLARDVFGARHRPVPAARVMIQERVMGMVA